MQAHVVRRYGGPEVVELAEVPTPVPGEGEVLVRIHATTVTSGDWRARTLEVPRGLGLVARLAMGAKRPRRPILGTELAGVIEAVGEGVTKFRRGDEVLAFPGSRMGCHAQYRVLHQDGPLARKPARLSFEEAASLCFGATTALHFLRKGALKPGETILVVGASGGVGTALVQLAKHQGAHVTGVTSTANLDLVKSLGADRVIDYTREDPLAGVDAYDIIADTVGTAPFARARHALKHGGRFLGIAAGLPDMLAAAWAPVTGRRVVAGPADESPASVRQVAELAEAGILRPVIGRTYEWNEMAQAHAYVETRRKRGSVVVRVRHGV